MKYLKFIFFLTFATIVNSCSLPENSIIETTLYGKWSLIEASGTIAGVTKEYEVGTITWDFASANVVVNNTTNEEDFLTKFQSGTYSFIINSAPVQEFECVQTISFSANDVNCLQYDNHTLFITQNAADGITLKFIR